MFSRIHPKYGIIGIAVTATCGWSWWIKIRIDLHRNLTRLHINEVTKEDNMLMAPTDEFDKYLELERQHKKYFNESISMFLYPDDSNGRFVRSLGYKHWYRIAIEAKLLSDIFRQQVYLFPLLLGTGLFAPYSAGLIGLGNLIGTGLLSFGYLYTGRDDDIFSFCGKGLRRVSVILAVFVFMVTMKRLGNKKLSFILSKFK